VIVGAAVVAVRDAWHPSWALGRLVVVCGVASLAALERPIRDSRFDPVWRVCLGYRSACAGGTGGGGNGAGGV
jgi:hypothetical protein